MTLFVYGSCELLSMRLRVTCIDCAEILPIEHRHGPGSPPSDSRSALPPAAVVSAERVRSVAQRCRSRGLPPFGRVPDRRSPPKGLTAPYAPTWFLLL